MNLITGRTIEPLVVKSDWWILFVILIILTYGSVHRWFKEYGLTVTQAAAIKQLKANLKESDKKPNQETLDKSWTIFSKYIVTELKVKRATLNTLLYAIIERNDKLGPDFYNIFEELWQKKGKDLTKEDLKNITKKMIKLIKRLG